MKFNFDKLNLSPESSLSRPSRQTQSSTLDDIKSWWQSLLQEEREKVFQLEVPEIVQEIADVTNNASLICKFNHVYKKKDLITSKKHKCDEQGINRHMFEFNLVGKEILNTQLAELFSCYSILVIRDQVAEKDFNQKTEATKTPSRSHIAVKKEQLDRVFSFLTSQVPDFKIDEKILYEQKDLLDLHSFLLNNPPKVILPNQKIPDALKLVLERLYSFSYLLKSKLFSTYLEQVNPSHKLLDFETQEAVNPCVTDQLTSLSSLANMLGGQPTPLLAKTVSQLEKESNPLDQNSTASDSPGNFVNTELRQQLNIDELSQKLLQQSSTNIKELRSPRKFSNEDSSDDSKNKINDLTSMTRSRSPPMSVNNDFQSVAFTMYEGFLIGSLEIEFSPVDAHLLDSEDDEDTTEKEDFSTYKLSQFQPEYYKDEEETASMDYMNERAELMRQAKLKGTQKAGEEEKMNYPASSSELSYQTNSYSSPMSLTPPLYNQSQHFYANQGYYPSYYNQKSPLTSYNYKNAIQFLDRPKTTEPTITEPIYSNMNYYDTEAPSYVAFDDQSFKKKSFDSNAGYFGEEEDYLSQNFNSYNQNNYRKPSGHESQDGEKNYYYANGKPRYETKVKLPPRLQRKRDNFYRN